MTKTTVLIDPELWSHSRSGARAGRGFRYQDAACALLSVQAWCGTVPWSAVVPEGVDDATLHADGWECRVQLKSRHDPRGVFTVNEVAEYLLRSAPAIASQDLASGRCTCALMLERPVAGLRGPGWDVTLAASGQDLRALIVAINEKTEGLGAAAEQLLEHAYLIIEPDPIDRAVELMAEQHGVPEGAARIAAHDLRHHAGQLADENYLASASHPASLYPTSVQARFDAVFSFYAPEVVAGITRDGLCEPVSFAPVETTDFYSGVDVTAGHVAAGLVFDRPGLVSEIRQGLARRRAALIAGPSGAGKSAAAWLTAHETRHAIRWHRVARLQPESVHRLITYSRAVEATAARPVGFVLDDVGRDFGAAWDNLVRECASQPGIVLLGSIREEDLFTLTSVPSCALARPVLDDVLAERIWAALSATGAAQFAHWREPFEKSAGLLLEYTHLLTSGQRLQETLNEQMRRRLAEKRDDELAILRPISFAAQFGASVRADLLRAQLQMEEGRFARALRRLIDEHAVRAHPDGALGGLHQIRSHILCASLDSQFPQPLADTATAVIEVLRERDLSSFLPRLLADQNGLDEPVLSALAMRGRSLGAPGWTSLFHGLGLTTADRIAARWCALISEAEVEERFAAFAFSMASVGMDFSAFPNMEALQSVCAQYSEIGVQDLRHALLARIEPIAAWSGLDLAEYHLVAASLAPVSTCPPAPPIVLGAVGDFEATPLDDILDALATARELGIAHAEALVGLAGGTGRLLDRIHKETAWVTRPTTELVDGVLAVASDVRYISVEVQPDIHADVVRLSNRLLAAAPRAELVISRAIGWDGNPAGVQDYEMASVRMPRENGPVPVKIAWHRAVLRAIQRRVGSVTETSRASALNGAITELRGMLEEAAEFYCRRSAVPSQWRMKLSVRALLNSYISPQVSDETVSSPLDQGAYSLNDDTLDFVNGVTSVMQGLVNEAGVDQPLNLASRAAALAESAEALLAAETWRWIGEAPSEQLRACATTLSELWAVLGDAHADPSGARSSQLRCEKTSKRNRALPRFARDAHERASQAVQHRLAAAAEAFARDGIAATVISRPLQDRTRPYWPSAEYAALVEVETLEEWLLLQERLQPIVEALDICPALDLAPVVSGVVVAGLGTRLIISMFPNPEFGKQWGNDLPLPLLRDGAASALSNAMDVVIVSSGIFTNLDRELNEAETAIVQMFSSRVSVALADMQIYLDADPNPDLRSACELVLEAFERLSAELSTPDSGEEKLSTEIARMIMGEPTDFSTRIIVHRLALLEQDIARMEPAA